MKNYELRSLSRFKLLCAISRMSEPSPLMLPVSTRATRKSYEILETSHSIIRTCAFLLVHSSILPQESPPKGACGSVEWWEAEEHVRLRCRYIHVCALEGLCHFPEPDVSTRLRRQRRRQRRLVGCFLKDQIRKSLTKRTSWQVYPMRYVRFQ